MEKKHFNSNHHSKKILQISSYPPPRAGWGVRVSFVKKALEETGHICDVINIAPESRKIPSTEYLTATSGLDYFWKCLKMSLKGYRIHMHLNGNSPKGFVLTIMAELANLISFKRPILTLHAGPYQIYFPKERAPYLIPMFKFIFGTAKKVICNSQNVKTKIVEYGITPEKVVPIPAFSVQYLNYERMPLDSSLQNFIDDKNILISSYVFFRPEFFIDDMVKAIAQLVKKYAKLGLLILGSDDGSEDIRQLVKELRISNHVYFTGDLEKNMFLNVLGHSDICLRTPIRDGVSSSVLEALSLGIPVVASENGRRPESVITYNHESITDMTKILEQTIQNLSTIKKSIVKPEIRDTVADEMALLVNA